MSSDNSPPCICDDSSYNNEALMVRLANDLVQKSIIDLKTSEYRIMQYIIAQIDPKTDCNKAQYSFSIGDFCRNTGISSLGGSQYATVKSIIQTLASKTFFLHTGNGDEIVSVRWIGRAYMSKQQGIVRVELDELMEPYLVALKEKYLEYSMYFTNPMQSKYSISLYLYLSSFKNMGSPAIVRISVSDLKKKLCAENYKHWTDFRKNTIDIALNEINSFSDIRVSVKFIKTGKKFTQAAFNITKIPDDDRNKLITKNISAITPKALCAAKMADDLLQVFDKSFIKDLFGYEKAITILSEKEIPVLNLVMDILSNVCTADSEEGYNLIADLSAAKQELLSFTLYIVKNYTSALEKNKIKKPVPYFTKSIMNDLKKAYVILYNLSFSSQE